MVEREQPADGSIPRQLCYGGRPIIDWQAHAEGTHKADQFSWIISLAQLLLLWDMSEASVGFEKPRYLSKSKQELRWIAMATTAPRVFKLKSVELEIAEHCKRIAEFI